MTSALSRRDFIRSSGALVIGFSFGGARLLEAREHPAAASAAPSASQLDSWLAIGGDDSITVFCGKVELGTGVSTALRQIVAEELDAPFERITWIQGDSDRTVDQGSTVGSQSIKRGGAQLRQAAAEARAALLELAATRLGAPVASLAVRDGAISVIGSPSRKASFGALIGGKRFERTVSGKAPTKVPSDYSIVGKPIHRVELPAKMTGRHTYVHDVRVDGMLHARVVRPASIGARLLGVDDSALRGIPGARLVRKGNFLAVVADREEDAIRAARALQPTWSESAPLPDMSALPETLMSIPATERVVTDSGDVPAAIARARRTFEARYTWPFQMHASIGPSCGLADVKPDSATVWSSTQGSHTLKGAIAHLLGLQPEAVHVIWTEGSGCYGHNGSDDAAADAALISQLVGRPVRVQWMRADEHGWEPKGAAMVMHVRGGLDESGRVVGWDYAVWTPTHSSRPSAQSDANFLAAQLAGATPSNRGSLGGERNARHTYAIPSTRVVAQLLQTAPLRTSSLRGLGSPQNSFANESFMDELAFAAGVDPVEFRVRHLTDPRAIAVVEAAARLAKWESGVSHSRSANSGGIATGQGFGFVQYEGTEAYVAAAVDVDVDMSRHTVRVKRVCIAHDCGLIVNPDGLRNQIEGNAIQGISRTLLEAVAFDRSRVTSLDWRGYPILTFAEAPDSIEIELIDHPELPSVGAGEASTSPMPGAIANAIFDATGVRLRAVPLRFDATG